MCFRPRRLIALSTSTFKQVLALTLITHLHVDLQFGRTLLLLTILGNIEISDFDFC